MKISTVEEMRALDRAAMSRFGIPELLLMENAGLAACAAIEEAMPVKGRHILILCGVGNNGGDGLVVARKLHSRGALVRIVILGSPGGFHGAARSNLEICERLPLQRILLRDPGDLAPHLPWADLVVDGIFGTGLSRPVDGLHKEVIEAVNRSGKPVCSLDIPSGIHGDTGRPMGTAIQASFTVTFGLPKLGNLLYPGFEHCGRLLTTHISFPPSLMEEADLRCEVNDPPPLPRRPLTAHKGTMGDVLFIAGAGAYYGAPYLSAYAFLKAGGGYSRLAAPKSMLGAIAGNAPELVFVPLRETDKGSPALEGNGELLCQGARKADMVVMGPGLSLDEETQALMRGLIGEIPCPLLLDGDGLTAMVGHLEAIAGRQAPTVLTPHPAELARLLGVRTQDILDQPVKTVRKAAADTRAVVVLKGAHSLVCVPDGRVFLNMTGNPGMATAGSGDVLTGTIAAMLGLGLPIPDAVRKGVFLHGVAGDLAARALGEDGITARDILEALPGALKAEREGSSVGPREGYRLRTIL